MNNIYDVGIGYQSIIREKVKVEEELSMLFNYWSGINTNKTNARVIETSRNNIIDLIVTYEWLGTLPVNYTRFVGLYFDEHLAGALGFVNVKFGGKYTLFNKPAYCLGRGACAQWAPKWAASYLVSHGIKLLFGNTNPPIYIVAYSDWSAGEIGTIYQACNWFYLGHYATKEWVDKDGNRYDINTPAVRAAPGFGREKNNGVVRRATKNEIKTKTAEMVSDGYRLVEGPTRGRYATVSGKKGAEYQKMLDLLKYKSRPYPKRAIYAKEKQQ